MSLRKRFRVFGVMLKVVPNYALMYIFTNLWTTPDFIKLHPEYLAKDNAMGFLSETGGDTYNLCHCEEVRSCGL